MKKLAVVQKCPSKTDYQKLLGIQDLDVYNLSEDKVSKLLKSNVTLKVDTDDEGALRTYEYEYIVLVGTEALSFFSTATGITTQTGHFVKGKDGSDNKYIALINPASAAMKPEYKDILNTSVNRIQNIAMGIKDETIDREYAYFEEGDTDKFNNYLKYILDNAEVVAMDTETTALYPRDGYLLGISLSHKKYQGIYAHIDCVNDISIKLIQDIVNTKTVVMHNAKFDLKFLQYHLGINFDLCDLHDTMLLHYILDERKGTHGLKDLTIKYGTLGDYDHELELYKAEYCRVHKIKKEDFTYDLIPFRILKVYAAKDTDATMELFEKFYPIVYENSMLANAYEKLLRRGTKALAYMEEVGIPVSKERLQKANEILVNKIEELQSKIYSHKEVKELEKELGTAFNPNSVNHLRKLLFDRLNLPSDKLTATGKLSTDAEVLSELAEYHELPSLILQVRKGIKLKNTYVVNLLKAIDRDGRVRTNFNLASTTSGRLSSSGKFNMQQLPRDNPIIKGCVKAKPGYKIVAVDLTTAEIYYAAVLSGDKEMQSVFIKMSQDPEKYPDFHASIAHLVFNLPCLPSEVKKLYPALRQAAKAISFGIMYGSGPAKVAEAVNEAFREAGSDEVCTVEDAKDYIETYFNKFPQLKRWIRESHNAIRSKGFIYNFFGRKRRLLNINSPDRGIAGEELRSGFNFVVQSVSSDHLLLGAMDAIDEIKSKKLDAEIFAVVHDSVVAHVREDLVDTYLDIIIRSIQTDRGCSIPGCPIGVGIDSEDGGSLDYSCGKLEKMYPEVAAL
jgi:DNA polymerase I-like protein with 3'-5' exonuclease and polymerase domains